MKTGQHAVGAGHSAQAGCLALLLAVTPALATTGNFAPAHVQEQLSLPRIGEGTAYYGRIIPVYDIALYAAPAPLPAGLLQTSIAKRLEIRYRVAIEAGDLARAAEQTLTRQHPPEVLSRWRRHIDALHASLRDVEKGDRYSLTFLPQRGMWLEYNDTRLIEIPDAEFSAVYFGIWLGEEPLSEPLKRQLVSTSERCSERSDVC